MLAVKENQKETFGEIKEYFEDIQDTWSKGNVPTDVWHSEIEKDHGRIERGGRCGRKKTCVGWRVKRSGKI